MRCAHASSLSLEKPRTSRPWSSRVSTDHVSSTQLGHACGRLLHYDCQLGWRIHPQSRTPPHGVAPRPLLGPLSPSLSATAHSLLPLAPPAAAVQVRHGPKSTRNLNHAKLASTVLQAECSAPDPNLYAFEGRLTVEGRCIGCCRPARVAPFCVKIDVPRLLILVPRPTPQPPPTPPSLPLQEKRKRWAPNRCCWPARG